MKCVELNPKGNFDCWDQGKILELREKGIIIPIDEHVLYEDYSKKLWNITLRPYERLPFQRFKNNYSITCLTEGLAITRFSDGAISLLKFKKGDTSYYEVNDSEMVNDLENIGEELLRIAVLEHKPIAEESPNYS